MTAKLFRTMLFFSGGILLFCVCLLVHCSGSRFETVIHERLAMEAELAARGVRLAGADFLAELDPEFGLTWIGADGTVLFDRSENRLPGSQLLALEEVQEALEQKTGWAKRLESEKGTPWLYYALALEDGTVLRVAYENQFPARLLFAMSQPLIVLLFVLMAASLILVLQLSKHIVRPLKALSMGNPELMNQYPEFAPLTNYMAEQNRTIGIQLDELMRREREFTAITEHMREAFVLFDYRGGLLSYNSSAAQLLSLENGRKHHSLSTDHNDLREAVNQALAGQHWEGYQTFGDSVYQCLMNPVVSSGQVMGAVLLMVDATEKQHRERLRREFSANVSHELKTPLTSISGFAELMMNGMIPPEKMQECAGDIYQQSQQLIHLVGDIIKISNLDEGCAFPMEQVDLYACAQRVAERLRPAAERKNIQFQLHGSSCCVVGVEQIIDEMIYNLCDNAIQYNVPGGSVLVNIRCGEYMTTVSVSDTGIGIPFGEQERVFERFYRVDKSHSKALGGTGLGLSIVKHGAQFHGADLSMNSAPGMGTTVQISFRKE